MLWLLHGVNMDADQWHRTGKVERYMDNLIAERRIRPFVVVMPSDGGDFYGVRGEAFITQELPAFLARSLGLRSARERSGIADMSIGGFGAFHFARRHADRHGFAVSLSAALSDRYIASLPHGGALPMQVLLLCGDADFLIQGNRKLVRKLQTAGAEFRYREDPGGHTWQYWSHRVVEMLTAADAYFHSGHLPSAAPR